MDNIAINLNRVPSGKCDRRPETRCGTKLLAMNRVTMATIFMLMSVVKNMKKSSSVESKT